MLENNLVVLGGSVCTSYGQDVTRYLVGKLAKNGICISSGFETKLSLLSLETAFKVGGHVIGFLGCGILRAKRINLVSKMVDKLYKYEKGKVVFPFSKNTPASKNSFKNRDKIMVNESCGVLVVESVVGSRIFNVLEYAMSENKLIFAVPGSIFSYSSEGTNFLIKNGAILVRDYGDILNCYR